MLKSGLRRSLASHARGLVVFCARSFPLVAPGVMGPPLSLEKAMGVVE